MNRYRANLNRASDAAERYAANAMLAYMTANTDATLAELREAMESILGASVDVHGMAAAAMSEQYLLEIAEAVGLDIETELYDLIDRDKVDEKARWAVGALEGRQLATKTGEMAGYYAKRNGFGNVAANCARNGIRYARVPSGTETCDFCIMLASRGFAYHSENAAGADGHYHRHCDCIIVPEGVEPEGYDPDALYRKYLESRS